MKPIIKGYKEEQKQKVTFSRVMTNKMSIVGWRMFQSDRILHFGFVLYRLKRDFGFTDWEIANFTGVPKRDLHNFMRRIKPLLDAEILKSLSEMNWIEEEHGWRSIPDGHGKKWQGYFIKKDLAWYDKSKYRKLKNEPIDKLGNDTNHDYDRKTSGRR